MKKFFAEFKEFISKGNVMDLAVGMIIGAAFTAIVNSLVNDILMPLIGTILAGVNFDNLVWVVPYGDNPTVNFGAFLSAIITFLVTAFCVFLIVKAVNGMMKKAQELKKKEEEEKKEEPQEDPADVKLLKEMVAILKEQNPEAAKRAEEKLAEK